MFPLYRTCAENLQQTPCQHSEEEWMLSSTWCSIQIHKALQLGYQMIQMVEVWIFFQKPSTLFRGYIDTFLKIKQEASGWTDWCDAEEKKQQYIQDYQTKEGITLDYDNIKKNPGLRSLAKLMLNSFCE